MKYKVVVHKRVVKCLNRLPRKEREIIKSSLESLREGKFKELKVKKCMESGRDTADLK